MNYLITVIIPTYNAEDFLKSAIDSVKNQSIGFENIELLLVDDNSSDATRSIIKEYSDIYDNIKYIFPEGNSGSPSRGRNVGIDNASSKYIMFLDQDDRYLEDCCEVLYNTIEKTQENIVMCNYINIINGDFSSIGIKDQDTSFKIVNPQKDKKIFRKTYMWDKIFKLDFLNKHNIRCPEGLLMEDVYFIMQCYLNMDRLVYLENYSGYGYNIREIEEDPSTSNQFTKNLIFKYLKTYYPLCIFFKDLNRQDLLDCMMKEHFIILIGNFTRLKEDYNSKVEILEEYCKLIDYTNFNGKLDELWANLIFVNIKNRNFKVAIFFSKIINILFNSYSLRKIYRRIYGREND
nr:glycosyltransferase family 2 protein [uncultured Methanobrevibacter sp.]